MAKRGSKANDTSLGNFNFAEITVGLIRIKRAFEGGGLG